MKRSINRYIILAASCLYGLLAGISMVWSIFRIPLSEAHGWSASQVTLAYSLFMIPFIAGDILSGVLQKRIRPFYIALLGGVIQGAGLFLTGSVSSLAGLYAAYAGIAGMGNGMIYNLAISMTNGWFPDRPGLANGIYSAVAGSAPLLFAPIGEALIDSYDVHFSFRVIGVITFAGTAIGIWFFRKPPAAGEVKEGEAKRTSQILRQGRKDYSPAEMLKSALFRMMWPAFLCALCSGVMMISQLSAISQKMISLTPAQAALVVGMHSVFSVIGRFLCGFLSDRVGRYRMIIIILLLAGADLIVFFPAADSLGYFICCLFFVSLCYGGVMTCFPGVVADDFGYSSFGVNYAIVHTSYTVATFLGPLIAAKDFEMTGNYHAAIIAAGVISLAGAALMFLCRRTSLRMGGRKADA